jgi:Phosphotransferase enzyme family
VTERLEAFAALRHPDEPRILFLRSDRDWRLPRVATPELWLANAAAIVPAFERRLGTTPWLLRALRDEQDEGMKRTEAVLELALRDPGWQPPAHGRWVGRDELEALRLRDEAQRELLGTYLDALEGGEIPAARPPWATPGWFEDVLAWVVPELERLGRRLHGIDQVKHWSISSVLRVRTDGPDLYFKVSARLPLFVAEEAVTSRLAERFPGYVPAPVAVDADRGWMLLPELGDLLDWEPPLELHQELFRRYAALQRRSVDVTAELLADGCLDRRLNVLETQLDPLLADPEATRRLTPDEVAELTRRAPELKEACRRLDACGVPNTLVHGDLHPGNVARFDGELVYFDWTDACIAHPFIDLHSLQWEKDETRRAALLEAYLGAWEGAAPPERLREAVSLAAVVTPLHHAVSYRHIVAALEPDAKSELDATHVFLREALARARDWPVG